MIDTQLIMIEYLILMMKDWMAPKLVLLPVAVRLDFGEDDCRPGRDVQRRQEHPQQVPTLSDFRVGDRG